MNPVQQRDGEAKSASCPQCGAALAAGTLGGLCPACLLKQGAVSDSGTTPPTKRFEPPSVAEVARLFPQLEVVELIGRGGMGAVYKARQPALDRWVAVKVLPVRPDARPGFAERFTQEARALARLNHPNIVAVHEFGQVEGLHYLVMEYVDGTTLRQMERVGRLSPREALQIVPALCDALQYAHDEGVVHRDIKPENVLVDRRGRVKIADFGLARLLDPDDGAVRLTGAGQVMGTPHYMAPEQVEHPLSVDHRADIYALGVVFYEMLTGELPLGRFPPPSARVRLDVRLDEVVLRALEKEPERRYQHASEVRSAVETIAQTPAGGAADGVTARPGASAQTGGEPDPARQVRGPAIGLFAVGVANWLVAMPVTLVVVPLVASRHGLSGLPPPWVVAAVLVAPFVFTGIAIVAALRMMRLQSYGLAVTAAVLSMVAAPANLVGFPIAVWALVVLLRREVRAAFREVRAGRPPPASVVSPADRRGAGARSAVAIVGVALAAVTLLAALLVAAALVWGTYHRARMTAARQAEVAHVLADRQERLATQRARDAQRPAAVPPNASPGTMPSRDANADPFGALRVKTAEAELAVAEAAYAAGTVPLEDVLKARLVHAVAVADAAGDGVGAARARLRYAQEVLRLTEEKFAAGMVTALAVTRARSATEEAQAELRKVQPTSPGKPEDPTP